MESGQAIGQYTLVRYLGKGGMAEVWEARHSFLANKGRLAIKCLLPQFATNSELQERFLREAQRQLDHPYIISAIDFFQINGLSYMVMRYVPPPSRNNQPESQDEKPQSLEDRLEEHHPLRLEEIHTFACDVLSALEFAHSQGVVHRDVKPANVLLHRNGHAMLTDFGIAKGLREERSMTRVGTSMGTPDYMSPEQIRAPQNVDARSDVYSFGCVLYAMLSRYPPFGNEETTEYEIKDRHVRFTPPPLVYWNRDIPTAVGDVVFKCLEKNPDNRYQSCEAVMHALDSALYPAIPESAEPGIRPVIAPLTLPLQPAPAISTRAHTFLQDRPATEPLPVDTRWVQPNQPEPPVESVRQYQTIPPVAPVTVPQRPSPQAAGGTRPPAKRGILIAVIAIAVVAGVAVAWYFTHKNHDAASVDWSTVTYNDPRLQDCKDNQACLDQKTQADKLLAADWSSIAFDSPLFANCMGYPQCLTEKDNAAAVKATTDWPHADQHLIDNCMQQPQCDRERARRAGANGSPQLPGQPRTDRAKTDQAKTHEGKPIIDDGREGWPDCCRDAADPVLCKKQKKQAGVYDCPTGK